MEFSDAKEFLVAFDAYIFTVLPKKKQLIGIALRVLHKNVATNTKLHS